MSTIETILSRAMSDPRFADLLFSDLEKAVADYDLSAEEYARLKSLARTEFEALAIEDRKSMATVRKEEIHVESFSWGGVG